LRRRGIWKAGRFDEGEFGFDLRNWVRSSLRHRWEWVSGLETGVNGFVWKYHDVGGVWVRSALFAKWHCLARFGTVWRAAAAAREMRAAACEFFGLYIVPPI